MSEIISVPIPIPIKYSKSCHSFSNPNNQTQNYLFELIIDLNNKDKKIFIGLESDKHCKLINTKDQIKFDEIKTFRIIVKKIPEEMNYQMEGKITSDQSFYTQNNENLFIEFSQNSSGYTICNCSFVGYDFFKICASPPN
jgi:hypothetical protein